MRSSDKPSFAPFIMIPSWLRRSCPRNRLIARVPPDGIPGVDLLAHGTARKPLRASTKADPRQKRARIAEFLLQILCFRL
jgi:hypothetical protein